MAPLMRTSIGRLISAAANLAAIVLAAPLLQRPPRAALITLSAADDLDLTGKVAFVAGVADSTGYGWAICKALAEAGALQIAQP